MSNLYLTATFSGVSGKRYKFEVYPKDTKFRDVSAVYIFCKRYENEEGITKLKPLYIGESGNLKERIETHEKWDCVDIFGCTHICVFQIQGQQARLDLETDLRNRYDTPCNEQ